MSAAFPPLDWGPLAFAGLVPLALVCRRGSPGRAAAAGAAFGLLFFGLLIPWIHLFGMAAYLLLVFLETAFVAGSLAAGAVMRRRLPEGAGFLAFPVAFLAGEFLRSHAPLGGFPWGGLGYSQHDNLTVLRLASYTGVWGVSLLVALVNALLAEAILAARSAAAGAGPPGLAGLVRAAVAVGLLVVPALLPVISPRGGFASLALVQGNPPQQDPTDPHATDREFLEAQVALTRTLAGSRVALVVWPESSLGHDPFSDPSLLDPLLASIRQMGAAYIVGATLDAPGGRFRNVSLFFRSDGSTAGSYVKMHLVPFGEYVPARRLLAGWIRELDRVPLDGIAGRSPTVFSLPQGAFASVICYETAYPELVRSFVTRGARMIVVSTNNSSYLRTAASAQMVAISQLRAAEERMWVAQAALTGISAVIAPSGRVVARTGLFRPALLTPTIRFATGTTVYGRYGDWLPVAVLVAGVLVLSAPGRVWQAVRRRGRATGAAEAA